MKIYIQLGGKFYLAVDLANVW